MKNFTLPPPRLSTAKRATVSRALDAVANARRELVNSNRTFAALVNQRGQLQSQIESAESEDGDVRAVAAKLPQLREALALAARRIERLESGLQPQCQALREALAPLSAEFIEMTSAWLAEIEQRYAADLTPFFCGDGRAALHGVKSMPLLVNLGHFSAGLPRTWKSSSTLLAVLADAEQAVNWTTSILAGRNPWQSLASSPRPTS